MKNLQLLGCLIVASILVFSSCTKEQVDVTPEVAQELSIDMLESNPDIQLIDIDNVPEGMGIEIVEDANENAIDSRTCCEIHYMYFFGTSDLKSKVTIEPNRSYYVSWLSNGVQIATYQFHNYQNNCRTVTISNYRNYNCNGLTARGVMGVGYDLCAEEFASCN